MVALLSCKPVATHAGLVWVKRKRFMGWACSKCAWEFNPSRIPAGNTLAQIRESYERECNAEFESHVRAKHSKCKS